MTTTEPTDAPARERITASLFALAWMTMQVESVARTFGRLTGDSEAVARLRCAGEDHRDVLDSIADRLAPIVADLGAYCNAQDMVGPADVALLGPVLAFLRPDTALEAAGQLTLDPAA